MRSLALFLSLSILSGALAFGQYKMDAAGDPAPSTVPSAIASTLQTPGIKILNGSGQVFCQLWLVKSAPASNQTDVTLASVPMGSLLGAIQFPIKGADRRDQAIKAGTYLLRYVLMPENGAPFGADPQRPFAVMVPVAGDPGPAAKLSFEDVIALSTKVSQTSHPAILSLAPGTGKVTLTKEAEHDWTLNSKMGETPIAVIVAGKTEN